MGKPEKVVVGFMMNDEKLETMLRSALIVALGERYAQMPVEDYQFSPKYQRKFNKMLKDPFAYARKCRRPLWRRAARGVVAAVLALAILTGVVFTVPQTRTIAVDLLNKWFGEYVSFFFENTQPEEEVLPDVEIGYLPEGYEFVDETNIIKDKYKLLQYTKSNNEFLEIYLMVSGDYFNGDINNRYGKMKFVKLENGVAANAFISDDVKKSSYLLWTSIDGKLFFRIEGYLSEDEMLNIANGIKIKE